MKHHSGKIRIIGGKHRGRLLKFPTADGLRPTPDRVRETLFNWLAPEIEGAKCLDLFAGSGALGIEAASRGATSVVLVESNRLAAKAIAANIDNLGIEIARVENSNAIRFLNNSRQVSDLVFLDPPYDSQLLNMSIQVLSAQQLIKPGGAIYLEHRQIQPAPETPPNWSLYRESRAGDVCARLYRISEHPG